MATLRLAIGNKNYSSWSMRPWVLMRQAGIPFEELMLRFDGFGPDSRFKQAITRLNPTGRVPVLLDGDLAVWDTLAIAEYLAEAFPEHGLWPTDRQQRARARSVCAEMHAGFGALRGACPVNLGKRYATRDRGPKVAKDVARITAIWTECRSRYGAGGPFLFGAFSGADAMYAPIATRLRTYGIAVDPVSEAYVETIHSLPAFQLWREAALKEPWIVPEDEADERAIENFRPHLKS